MTISFIPQSVTSLVAQKIVALCSRPERLSANSRSAALRERSGFSVSCFSWKILRHQDLPNLFFYFYFFLEELRS